MGRKSRPTSRRAQVRRIKKMAQKHGYRMDPGEIAGCYGKVRWTKSQAKEKAKALGGSINAYECFYCHHWHIGKNKYLESTI